MGNLKEAEQYLEGYRQVHENSSAVWYALGFLYYLKDDHPKADELFKRATELDHDNGLAWNNWAASLAKVRRYQDAVEKVQMAMRVQPDESMFFINLNKIYNDMGEGQRFEDEFNELVGKGDPVAWGYGKTLARSIRQKSFGHYSKGNLAETIAGFEKILEINKQIEDVKGQVPALFSLGLLYEENGDARKAQEFFRKVLSINPDHIQAREKVKPLN